MKKFQAVLLTQNNSFQNNQKSVLWLEKSVGIQLKNQNLQCDGTLLFKSKHTFFNLATVKSRFHGQLYYLKLFHAVLYWHKSVFKTTRKVCCDMKFFFNSFHSLEKRHQTNFFRENSVENTRRKNDCKILRNISQLRIWLIFSSQVSKYYLFAKK